MSFVGRNNAKISNRPSGGGNKKQGLAPKATFFFKAPFTGQQYSTGSGSGRDRFKLVCMNQLGGIGRGRSQFGVTADGTNCDLTLQYIADIQSWLKGYMAKAIGSDTIFSQVNEYGKKINTVANFQLCYVGEEEKFWKDISDASGGVTQAQLNTLNSEGFDISGKIFTHLKNSGPITNLLNDSIYLIDISNGLNSQNVPLIIPQDIQSKIDYVNGKVPAGPPNYFINGKLGRHTLGILNNNFILDTSNGSILRPRNYLYADHFGVSLNGLIAYKTCYVIQGGLYHTAQCVKPPCTFWEPGSGKTDCLSATP